MLSMQALLLAQYSLLLPFCMWTDTGGKKAAAEDSESESEDSLDRLPVKTLAQIRAEKAARNKGEHLIGWDDLSSTGKLHF